MYFAQKHVFESWLMSGELPFKSVLSSNTLGRSHVTSRMLPICKPMNMPTDGKHKGKQVLSL